MTILSQILEYKIVTIIRGARPGDVVDIADALYKGGVKLLEITLNSENAFDVIRTVSARFENKMLIGAGTVLTAEEALKVIDCGAKFIISPSTDFDVIKVTKQKGIVSIPGAYTPTEIVNAYKAGADIIKVFPASTPKYIKEVLAPLSHIPLMPTGGISLENIAEFQKSGAIAFGIGTSLVDTKKEITGEYLDEITKKAELFNKAINHYQLQ